MTDTAPEHNFPKTSRPATDALLAAGYTRLEELSNVSEKELLKLHGMGPKAIRILKAELEARGLSFADEQVKG